MGTWGYRLGENDAFLDVYDGFFTHYNSGMPPPTATQHVTKELADYFTDSDDTHEAYFALALALWETQSLDAALLQKVKEIVSSGANLRHWAQADANKADIEKRRKALDRFLKRISRPRHFRKRRVKQLYDYYDYKELVLIKLPAPDGLKVLTILENSMDGEFIHTAGMVMWAGGGGSIFHINRSGLKCTATWRDAQNLEICFSNALESEFDFGIGNKNQAFYCGDKVALTFLYA